MSYISLSIKKNNSNKKYILFYAEYLNEAWLSEVLPNDATRIVKQFSCKNIADVQKVAAFLSKSGEVLNLAANDSADKKLMVLQQKLTRNKLVFPTWTQCCNAIVAAFSKPAFQ